MPAATAQMKVAIGTVEVTDTDRRAIAWEYDGAFDESTPKVWVLDATKARRLASREECRTFIRKHGEHGVTKIVAAYLNAGGATASQEAK